MKTLSKSKYCNGLQCPKILWLHTHCPEEIHHSESTKKAFAAGHTVGNYAKNYFGDYVEPEMDYDNFTEKFPIALEQTKSYIDAKQPTICEAAFFYKNARCFADILRVNDDGSVEMYEVKHSASVKPQYYDDMAIQYYVIKNCGYNITKVALMHIDKSYIRKGDIEPQKMFKIVDCTQEVLAMQNDIPAKIEELLQYAQQNDEPEMPIGEHCADPYPCAFWAHCHKNEDAPPSKEKKQASRNTIRMRSKIFYPKCVIRSTFSILKRVLMSRYRLLMDRVLIPRKSLFSIHYTFKKPKTKTLKTSSIASFCRMNSTTKRYVH